MKLEWDKLDERLFETGTDHGVLYIVDNRGQYTNSVVWNGLTGITESNSGAEETALWADNIKYATLRSAEEYGLTIEAYGCPDEFHACDGSSTVIPGLMIGQQGRKSFGFSYRTRIGNSVRGADYGYKLHLVYGCSASPSERGYQTINESPDAVTLSWEISTTPATIPGFKPVSHIIIDSTAVDPEPLAELEEALYGTEDSDPFLPLPAEALYIVTGEKARTNIRVNSNYVDKPEDYNFTFVDDGEGNITIGLVKVASGSEPIPYTYTDTGDGNIVITAA